MRLMGESQSHPDDELRRLGKPERPHPTRVFELIRTSVIR